MAENVFTRAAAIRKKNPGKKWQTCVKEAGKQVKGKVSGVRKKKTVAGVKRKKTPLPKIKVTNKKVTIGAIGAVATAKGLAQQINVLERQRKALKGKELREINRLEINALHKKLEVTKKRI